MPGPDKTTVETRLEGLFLLLFNKERKSCEAKIHTAAKGHRMIITIKENGIVRDETRFSQKKLLSLHPISIFVSEGENKKPTGSSVTAKPRFKKILDLEGKEFYNRPLDIRPGFYGASINLNNGVLEETEIVNCAFRVKETLFAALKKLMRSGPITEAEWEAFKKRALKEDPDSIKPLAPFASDAKATVSLKKGQKLWITSGKKRVPLFDPIEPGKNYEIIFDYTDTKKPSSIRDCLGFANHCEAMRRKKGEPVYCIFYPEIKPDPDGTVTSTPSGLCLSARIDPEG